MAKTTRLLFRLVLVFAILCATMHESSAARPRARNKPNAKYAAIIMDAQTGRVLQEQNADRILFPASLTKMMTLFLLFEAMENGQLRMDSAVKISSNAIRQPPSKLGLKIGERLTIKQAILALVTRSANDVAVAVAETVGGSEKSFTRMMTERARSLGMRNSSFVNPSGLPSPYQQSSARDMAILSRALMQYFPQYYHLFNTKSFVYKGQDITTHNHLMERFPGMDGLKTGYTYASGFNLAASAVKNNRRVIVVVFGGRTANSRDQHVAELMNQGFAMLARTPAPVQVATATTTTTPMADGRQVQTTTIQTTTIQEVLAKETAPAQAVPAQAVKVTSTPSNWTPDGGRTQALRAPATQPTLTPVNQTTTTSVEQANWGIQVGAFGDPALGHSALQIVRQQLNTILADAQPVVVPTRTANGVMYRARLTGLTAQNAAQACAQLTECIAFTVK